MFDVCALVTPQISIPEAVELLLDAVLNPKLQQWEVEKVAQRLEGDLEAFKADPHACLLEVRFHCDAAANLRQADVLNSTVCVTMSA